MDCSRVIIRFMFHVVDDEEIMRKVLVGMFQYFDFEVQAFGCPSEYIEHMNRPEYKSPIAIFSDIEMPDMNGYDFMYQVRQANPAQRFVILSGAPEIKHDKKNLACMYLYKPLKLDLLKDIIDLLIKCDKNGSSEKMEVQFNDDRAIFGINSWTCPNGRCVNMSVKGHPENE